ncbi:Extended Synaptotagmin-2 [Manis pentadactyla]|nr:Extended Synaptotagmin-2 [Manis pentadactyla]
MQTLPSTSPCIHVHSMSVIEMTESSSEIAAQTVFLTLMPQTLEHCWFPHNWGRGAELTCRIHGTMRVILEPLIGYMPLVGALSIFFLRKPVSQHLLHPYLLIP